MKTDRLIAIIMILLERKKMTADQLAEMFEVSPRTIYRDLDSINQAGIPIVSQPGPGNGIGIMETYKVEKRLFSTSDITTLLMALSSVKSGIPGVETANTFAKVKGMIPENERIALEFQANQIKIDTVPWLSSTEVNDKIELVKSAMEAHLQISFTYRDIRNRKSHRIAEPYRLLLRSESWYVQGFCLERQEFRTFKLVRVEALEILEQSFELRNFPADQMDRPVFNDIKIYEVKLRVDEFIKDDIISRFGSSCLSPDTGDAYVAIVHMPADELAYRYLLGFGSHCECLGPKPFRDKMKLAVEQLYSMYQD